MKTLLPLAFALLISGCTSMEAGFVHGWNAAADFQESLFGKAYVERIEISPAALAWLVQHGWIPADTDTEALEEPPQGQKPKTRPREPAPRRQSTPAEIPALEVPAGQDDEPLRFNDGETMPLEGLTPDQQEEIRRFFRELERQRRADMA